MRTAVVNLDVRTERLGKVLVDAARRIRRNELLRCGEDVAKLGVDTRAIDAAAERAVKRVPKFMLGGTTP